MSLDNITDGTDKRVFSQLIFQKVKPFCIQLTQEALTSSFNEAKVVSLLTSIEEELKLVDSDNQVQLDFLLLPNVADYIFFPISNLLKKPELSDAIVQHILSIIGYLVEHCWKFNVNYSLFDQLFPLVLFLIEGDSRRKSGGVGAKPLQFKRSSVYALNEIVYSLQMSYFQETVKRLHFSSRSISLALEILNSTKASDQETVGLLVDSCRLVQSLLSKLDSDKKSTILPGVVSGITNFVTSNSSLNYRLFIQILRLLSSIICTSFNDKDLHAELKLEAVANISDLQTVWDDDERTLDGSEKSDISIQEHGHRTMSWLMATSKQLKITLVILFRSLLLSSRNKDRLRTRTELADEVLDFVTSVMGTCFVSLYAEFVPLALDICAILVFASSWENGDSYTKIWEICTRIMEVIDTDDSKCNAYYEVVRGKLSSLIDNKLSFIVFSADEDKVSLNLNAIELHFAMLSQLSWKNGDGSNDVQSLRKRCLRLLSEMAVDHVRLENSQKPNAPAFSLSVDDGLSNQLDNIELPGHINARNVKKVSKPSSTSRISYTHQLQLISSQWSQNTLSPENDLTIGLGSKVLESNLYSIVSFLSKLKYKGGGKLELSDLEDILEDSGNSSALEKGVVLWFASHFAKNGLQKSHDFDPTEFMNFESSDLIMDDTSNANEATYLLLVRAEGILDDFYDKSGEFTNMEEEVAYISAIDAIGCVVGTIPLTSFRSDVLMDYLLCLFQALTLTDKPRIQSKAQKTLKSIVDCYYEGSATGMIMDNVDYLIDAISLQMTVASNLTPSLPGILIILIRITGVQLLESNQLFDIFSDIFVILDSYHGYNQLVEGFFVVFEVLVEQIKQRFLENGTTIEDCNTNESQFKPWGMACQEQLIHFLSDKSYVDPLGGFDSEKEYFQRTEDKPFDEMGDDSDDEVDEDDSKASEEEPWISPIPKPVYEVLKRIFTYGFTLISQPSYTLKAQIIKTLRLIFPLLCTNYKLLLPMMASNWSVLITLITASNSLSTAESVRTTLSREQINITIESLKFVTEILHRDRDQQEYFFSRKFQETWSFISNHSELLSKPLKQEHSTEVVVAEKAIATFKSFPILKESLVEFLIAGAQNYEKTIPDLTRFELIRLCYILEIPRSLELTRDTQCVLEVLKTRPILAK
ncbi:Tti1 protein [Candida orthopsilosis Co 90-125]|uniref:Tti1 protein n=1 Tax=Candida orthopsilosis (strain 90-125) TaxID=1136231 RepID=H8X1Y8_CANO9|nr:Tti1 protein [Candida orthopsilosis Co 90-125]CCG22709.1 Tti1 protein [Candida orthopsilosis Co 90-125]